MTKNYNLFILFLKDADPVSKGTAGSENCTILNSDFFFVFVFLVKSIYIFFNLISCTLV